MQSFFTALSLAPAVFLMRIKCGMCVLSVVCTVCRTRVHSRQRTLERRVMASQRAVRTTFESTEQAKAQNRVANLDKYIRDVGNETRKRIDDRLEAVTLQSPAQLNWAHDDPW